MGEVMFKAAQIAQWCDGKFVNDDESKIKDLIKTLDIQGVAPLGTAGPTDLAFFFSKHYQEDLLKTRAGIIITGLAFVEPLKAAKIPAWKNTIFIAAKDPYLALAQASAELSKCFSSHDHQEHRAKAEIHSTAVIHPTVKLGQRIQIGAYVVIEEGSVIGDDVVLYPHCFVGKHCQIKKETVLFPRVTLYEKTRVGERCRIHAGAVIGGDGFGYAPEFTPDSRVPVRHQKIYHLGGVFIGDDVEIGANTTIDRGTLGDTRIDSTVKLDNLVQIGHNCNIGEGSIICGAAAMSGSSSTGKFVTIGGQSGAGNQVHIGDYAKLAAYTGVAKDVEPMAEMGGIPGRPLADHYKILALQQRLLRERGRKK